MKTKSFTLLGGAEEGWYWSIRVSIREDEIFQWKGMFRFDNQIVRDKRYRLKNSIRAKDREWVYRNIPSSIAWKTENHHDWKDGGRLYLLTKGEHILRHRREK